MPTPPLTRARPHRRLLSAAIVLAGLGAPAALFAQAGGDVSRSPEGAILHRRPNEPGRPADGPVADTPVFVYDPGRGSDLPSDLVRDGRSLPRPSDSLEPQDGELVHTADGMASPPPATPLPAPDRNTVNDPSAPFPANRPDGGTTSDPDAALAPSEDEAEVVSPNVGADASAAPGEPARGADGAAGLPDGPVSPDDPNGAPSDSGPAGPDGVGLEQDPRDGLGNEALPDRKTEREGTLNYNEVFDPSVVPFKRNRALDEVGADFGLRNAASRFEVLEPLGNRVERGREVFWGSVLVEGPAARRIPIPSVSPEGRILSYQASPEQVVVFERDEAGNFYATPERDGRLRLVFVTDAPAHWFGRSLPPDLRFEDVPRALRPKVPRAVVKDALEVAEAIGVDAGQGFTPALQQLVAYFRAFEPGEPPPSTSNIYRDLALGRRGVCRHRAHAFVITAQALGIPARYVFNEAHVFVEVYIPGKTPGWLRVDLGGGADELRVHGTEGKTLHEPLGPDPFERPPAFAEQQPAGATRAFGVPEPESASRGGPGEPGGPGEAGETSDAAPGMTGLPSIAIPRARPEPRLAPTRTTFELADTLVFRGDGLRVSGQVTAVDGRPVGDGVVQILLVEGPDKVAVAQLGTARLGPDGRYTAEVVIPADQPTGNYDVLAEFVGNGVFAASVGE